MIAFILKVSLCWLFFYGIYELFLKNKTFFNANRSYLLVTLVAGILLPLLEFIPWKNESNVAYMIYPMLVEIDDLQAVVISNSEEKFNWINVLYVIYGLGFSLSMFRFSLGLGKIIKLYRKSEKTKQNGYTIVLTDEQHLPFSFFRWVFFSREMKLTEEVDRILIHEIEHIKGRHSFDVLAIELLKVVFWCSPMIYLYRNALKEVHEYLADHVVVRNSDKLSYKRLLLDQTNSGLQMALTHQFFNSHLKNRLKMISQKRSGRPTLVMYALGIPVLLLLMFAFTYAFQEEGDAISYDVTSEYVSDTDLSALEAFASIVSDTVPLEQKTYLVAGEIFKVVEEMPRFPGCEDKKLTAGEIEDCAKQKMLEHIYKNIRYSKEDRQNGIQGMSVVQFVVDNEGVVGDINVVRSLSAGTDAEVIRVTESMNNLSEKWRPGYQRGKAVNVLYTLPVRFKLQGDDPTDEERKQIKETEIVEEKQLGVSGDEVITLTALAIKKKAEKGQVKEAAKSSASVEEIFKVVEEMPRFPGCEDQKGTANEIENCAKQKMLEHIYKNLKYPKEDRENGIQGMAVVQFVVDKSGEVRDIRIVRSVSEKSDVEVIKVTNMMNDLSDKWRPGMQRGKAVNVLYTLPVRFKLNDENPIEDAMEKKAHVEMPRPFLADKSIVERINSEKNTSEPMMFNDEQVERVIYIIDGKIARSNEQRDLEDSSSATYNVTKGEEIVYKEFGFKNVDAVMEIMTKKYRYALPPPPPPISEALPHLDNEIAKGNIKALIYLDAKEYKGKVNDLSPESIASINVLKGKKATTKYGAKAKDGVIEITSKGNVSIIVEEIPKRNDGKEEITIAGQIKDVNGKPLIGANILAKSIGKGTVSDLEGNFQLQVPAGTDLEFSYVGYTTNSLNVLTNKVFNVVLAKSDGQDGQAGKTSVLVGEAEAEIKRKNRENAISLSHSNSEKEPLFIVDGKEKADAKMDLDPNNIAEISVLKGENAIKKYGEKGINGVVEVITKNPSKGSFLKGIRKVKKGSGKNSETKIRTEDEAVNDLRLSAVKVYPNPARESINVSFEAAAKPTTIQLIDIDGKLIKDFSDQNFSGKFEKTIDLSDISSKLVLLRIEQEGKAFTKKIIIE